MAELPGWKEVKELIVKIASLTANVEKMQDQLGRALDQIEKNQSEISDLKADIRVLRAELKGEAQQAALDTVISAHGQMLERVVLLENSNRLNASGISRIDDQHHSSNDAV